MKTISAGVFKAKCLSLLDEVIQGHETIVVTKRGVPIAKISSPVVKKCGQKARLKGSVLKEKDLISPVQDSWKASSKRG